MRLTEDGVGLAEAIRVYVYRKRLVKERKKYRERCKTVRLNYVADSIELIFLRLVVCWSKRHRRHQPEEPS